MIKPIETKYKGYRFRSRLEARWAVFFDKIAVKWQYEPEGFDLGENMFYLPDFHIENVGWIEIKPSRPNDEEGHKAQRLAMKSGERVFIFYGEIPYPCPDFNYNNDSAMAYFPDGGGDLQYFWCWCPRCFKCDIQFNGRGARICQHHGGGDKDYTFDNQFFINAYEIAKSARFEFDERNHNGMEK